MMNKKLAHLIGAFLDLLAIGAIFIGCKWIGEILFEMNVQAELIEFDKYTGFIFVAIAVPALHILGIIENLWPKLFSPYREAMEKGIVSFAILLFLSCYILINWVPVKLESEGYVYCQTTSVGIASRVIIYTIDDEVCQELGPSKYQQLWDKALGDQ